MKGLINQHKAFFYLFFSFQALGLLVINTVNHGTILMKINSLFNSFFNTFFEFVTYLGDGLLFLLLILFLSTIKYRHSIIFAFGFVISGGLAQLIKNIIQAPRPKNYFESIDHLNVADNWTLYSNYSFPSGHTTTAFCIATLLVLSFKFSNSIKMTLFTIALIVGISRIYLLQHFFLDVYAGAILGTFSGLIIFYYFDKQRFESTHWMENKFLNKKQ